MARLKPSTQFKKDLKRVRNHPRKMEALKTILQMLEDDMPIPQEYSPHSLVGNYAGCMECHIESDFLLIWQDRDEVYLMRLGSHSELFKK